MKCTQLLAMGLLAAGACWCSVMAAEPVSPIYRSRGNSRTQEGRYEGHHQGRALFGHRTGFYGDPYYPGFGILSAIAPLAFVGGLTALAAHAFGFIGSGSAAANPSAAPAVTTEPVNMAEAEAATESPQQAEENSNASEQDDIRRRLEKIRLKGGYLDAKTPGLKYNRHQYSTTYRPRGVYGSTGSSKGHVSYSSGNGHRYEYDYNGNRRFGSNHGKDDE